MRSVCFTRECMPPHTVVGEDGASRKDTLMDNWSRSFLGQGRATLAIPCRSLKIGGKAPACSCMSLWTEKLEPIAVLEATRALRVRS
jgi:hypothetical protein